jgi:predicted lipoprotein with Yx(FWY)xxD motif
MKLMIPIGAALTAAVALAGCGGGGNSGGERAGSAGTGMTVTTKQIAGVGTVLVDRGGGALYAPDQEAGGRIRCVGACTSIWKPLTIASGKPTGVVKLGVIRRPDGTRQVTSGGRPLYGFVQDQPGKVSGNGASDSFGGRRFTWHVITAKGAPANGGASQSSGGGSKSSGGGYSY